MRHFDLYELIKHGDRAEKTFWKSMEAAIAVTESKNVKVISPSRGMAEYFVDQVKKRPEEHYRLFEGD